MRLLCIPYTTPQLILDRVSRSLLDPRMSSVFWPWLPKKRFCRGANPLRLGTDVFPSVRNFGYPSALAVSFGFASTPLSKSEWNTWVYPSCRGLFPAVIWHQPSDFTSFHWHDDFTTAVLRAACRSHALP